MFGNVLYRANAHGGEGEGDAKFFCGACGVDFAIGVLHAGEAHRGYGYGHFGGLPHHADGGAAVVHVDRHPLAQFDFLKIALIGAVGAFGPRTRVGIVVKHAGHAFLSQHAQVFNVGDDGHGALQKKAVSAVPSGAATLFGGHQFNFGRRTLEGFGAGVIPSRLQKRHQASIHAGGMHRKPLGQGFQHVGNQVDVALLRAALNFFHHF